MNQERPANSQHLPFYEPSSPTNADFERGWLLNIGPVFVNEFQAKTTTCFAVHGHIAPLYPCKAFLPKWIETQTPKSTQIEQ